MVQLYVSKYSSYFFLRADDFFLAGDFFFAGLFAFEAGFFAGLRRGFA